VSDTQARLAHERDYIARTIATVRIHKDADNCWPQWANIFADQIESLEAELERVTAALRAIKATLGPDVPDCCCEGCQAEMNETLRIACAALAGAARAAQEPSADPFDRGGQITHTVARAAQETYYRGCKCGCDCGSDNAECKCGCDCDVPLDDRGRLPRNYTGSPVSPEGEAS
jgi:hypothetical protein